MVTGTPSSGPAGSPAAHAAADRSASLRAVSYMSDTTTLQSASVAFSAATTSSTTSTGVNDPAR